MEKLNDYQQSTKTNVFELEDRIFFLENENNELKKSLTINMRLLQRNVDKGPAYDKAYQEMIEKFQSFEEYFTECLLEILGEENA